MLASSGSSHHHLHTRKLGASANPKDTVEEDSQSLVCKGKISLAEMQNVIAINWTTALSAIGNPSGK
jgi:hypothetical protein